MPCGHIPGGRKWASTNRKEEGGWVARSRHIRLVDIGRTELVGWAFRPIHAGTSYKYVFACSLIRRTICVRARQHKEF
jgi:hypothetical protein